MENLKRLLSVSCLSLVCLSSAFAENNLFAPTPKGRFHVGIDALNLRPNADNLTYALISSDLFEISNRYQVLDPSYDWGFCAHVGYQFPDSGYDIDLAYTRFNSTDNDSVTATPDEFILILPLSTYPLGSNRFRNADSEAEFDLKVTDLDVGRNIMGNNYNLRLFGGLRYANFSSNLQVTGTSDASVFCFQNTTHRFKGVGPLIGTEGRFALLGGLGIDGVADMAFLVGETNSNLVIDLNDGNPEFYPETKNSVIPVFGAKIGLDYTFQIGGNHSLNHSLLVFEGGYQTMSYLNILTNVNVAAAGDSITNASGSTGNLSFNGVYLGAKCYI